MQLANEMRELVGAAQLFELAKADDTERDVAWWTHCVTVSERIDNYVPVEVGEVPLQLRQYYSNLEALIEAIAPTANGHTPIGIVFGQWRAHVTDIESLNAGRLEVLAGAVWRLREMRERATKPELIDAQLRHIGQFVVNQYRVIQPVDAKTRLWSSKVTRRFDLLPREWRHL